MACALVIPKLKGTDILFFQRRDDKAPTDPNLLGMFGGHIEDGEDALTAAYRELGEETSLKVVEGALRFLLETDMPSARGGLEHAYVYGIDIDDKPFEVYEGDSYERYTAEEFLALPDISRAAGHVMREVLKVS